MQNAIEFITKKKKGEIIEIPKEYADEVSGEFRVILILNAKPKKKAARKRVFKALKLDTKAFKFNRDEIYKA
jgi:hypothetical protein